jgi:N-acetylglutamate synthase-like GNAT family acetyltransferase
MIKRLTDLSDISGSLPLVSVIQTDLLFACADAEGVFFQEVDGIKTLVLSLRGTTATICKLSDFFDAEELLLFLAFRQIKNVLSDFYFEGCSLQKRAVLEVVPKHEVIENINVLSALSSTKDYKSVFELLAHEGEFEAWFPSFCRKINNGYACGVYLTDNESPVSCAVAPFVFNSVGVVAGVCTTENSRKKGLGSKCVKALLADLKTKGAEQVYLWCEEKNIKFYESIGFSVCGEIYVKREE